MNPDRYRKVDQIFQQALSQSPERRESFLDEACAGDAELRREVESLMEDDPKSITMKDIGRTPEIESLVSSRCQFAPRRREAIKGLQNGGKM